MKILQNPIQNVKCYKVIIMKHKLQLLYGTQNTAQKYFPLNTHLTRLHKLKKIIEITDQRRKYNKLLL